MKIFTNVSALEAATLTANQLIETKGFYSAGDGGQARYLIKTAADYGSTPDGYGDHTLANGNVAVLQQEGTITIEQFGGDVAASIAYAKNSGAVIKPTSDLTIDIPTDCPILQNFFDVVPSGNGYSVILNIESGHSPASGIDISDTDCSFVSITSDDATVTLDSTFSITTDFLRGIRSNLPLLNCLVDGNGLCLHGITAQQGSYAYVGEGCGVINVRDRGIYLNDTSGAQAKNAVFTGVGTVASTGLCRGAWVARGSTLIAEGADFSDSEGIGVYVSRASTVHAMDLKAENCSDQAIWCHRSSRLTAHSVIGTGTVLTNKSTSTEEVVRVSRTSNVSINADAGTAPVTITQNGSGDGVTCSGASICNVFEADISGGTSSSSGIDVSGGSTVEAQGVVIDGFNYNVLVSGGTVNAPLSTMTAARTNGVNAKRGNVNLASASVTGSVGLDISNNTGSFTRADGCTTTNGAGSPDLADVNTPSFSTLTGRGVIFV